MGVPINPPPSPPPRFTPSHSAKSSWSASYQLPTLPPPLPLANSSSSPHFERPHDTIHPPLASLANVPPLPSVWGAFSSSDLTHSPVSILSPTSPSSSSPLPSASASTRVEPSWIHHQVYGGAGTEVRTRQGNGSRYRHSPLLERGSSFSTSRAHPSVRRISRAPVFTTMTSLSVSTTSAPTSISAAGPITVTPALSAASSTFATEQLPDLAAAGTTATRTTAPATRLPPTSRSAESPVGHPSSSSPAMYPNRPPPLSFATSPLTLATLSTARASLQGLDSPASQTWSSSHDSSTSRNGSYTSGDNINRSNNSSSTWNYRYVNSNHIDNRGRVDIADRLGYGTSGYNDDDHRLRQEQLLQQQQQQAGPHRRRQPPQPQHHNQHDGHHQQSHLQRQRLDGSPIYESVSNPNASTSSSLSLTTLPSYLQGLPSTTRTVIRAHAIHQGAIHIYSEDHDPIYMYGRPILTSPTSTTPR